MNFDEVDQAIESVRTGQLVVVVDDHDRENEGDLVMAAACANPERIAFMVRHTSGILCAPVTQERADQLRLNPMVMQNDAPLSTAFTVSVDYRHGLSTGISSEERANTILALANSNTQASDFVRPGHVFPLIARRGGVLVRSGHTEAAIDLAVAAGCSPVGLLAEIVNDDGSVKRLHELVEFAQHYDLRIISISDLIAWRQRREKLVSRIDEFVVQTSVGTAKALSYRTKFEDAEHLALIFGRIKPSEPVLVRIHRGRLIEDVFGPQDTHRDRLIDMSLKHITDVGAGIFIYLRGGFEGVPLDQLRQSESLSQESIRAKEWLEIGVGAQILVDLGLTDIKVLAPHEMDYVGLEGFGLRVCGTEILN